jgi:multidrug efflux system outer membrane protein
VKRRNASLRPRAARLGALCAALLAAGCTVGPNYLRPEVPLPPAYRGAEAAPPKAPAAASFGDLAWDTVFTDPDLQALIRTALAHNFDVRGAAARIAQAQSQLPIVRSAESPTVDAALQAPYNTTAGSDRPQPDSLFEPRLGVGFGWELDFWGKFRRATEAAQAELLASEDARYAVMATLVAQVGQAYLSLRALDLTLEISRRTVDSRTQSLELVKARVDGGVAGILDVRQAETLLYTATKSIPQIQRQIEQTENFINVLLGQDPGPIPRGRPLDRQIAAPELPPGLPTELLTRRPDIRLAEQRLVAANAQIGVAMAQLYPQVTLSGFAGAGGSINSGTSFGPYGIFSLLPAVTLPIFNAGRLQANVEFNEAAAQAAALVYQQTLKQALREVSDSLVDIRKRREYRRQQELLVAALSDASQVANLRYEGGVASYLEVLDTDRQYFDAELDLVQAKRDEATSVVQLYRALGGGWHKDGAAPAAAGRPTTTALAGGNAP